MLRGTPTPALSFVAGLALACSAPLVRDIPMLGPGHPHFEIEHVSPVRSPQFRRAVGNLLGPQIEPGNRVETLLNGDQIFPSMLAAIRGARRSIDESYIYWKGEIGGADADLRAGSAPLAALPLRGLEAALLVSAGRRLGRAGVPPGAVIVGTASARRSARTLPM